MGWTKNEHQECYEYLKSQGLITSKEQFKKWGAGGHLEVIMWRHIQEIIKQKG